MFNGWDYSGRSGPKQESLLAMNPRKVVSASLRGTRRLGDEYFNRRLRDEGVVGWPDPSLERLV
jgi:hypothetical protein